ncbi:caveolin-1-like [Physella acuta]|uniref:caveolin-1-like n=1 Tax=Physella acuta TaxID=109671 RepID=UPI0027DAC391|nr:caveolin-1-like [Physella acuta]
MKLDIDVINRDPNSINDHVKVAFEDVLAEPDGGHSFSCVWKGAYCCFCTCKRFYYNLFAIIGGLPMAMVWGIIYAFVNFYQVWLITPCMRIYIINCGCCQKFYSACIQCYMQPVYEAMSYCFSNIRVTTLTG